MTGGICGALVAIAITCPVARAAGGPADWMYEPTSIVEIHLTLPPASIAELEAEPKEYVEGTFSLAETDGTPGSAATFSAPLTVGIELKGSLGSLRRVYEKAAFKVKFDKYVTGQTFLGLEKMTLNNMVEDPSMVHEATTYQAFHDMGVPAPHVGFAYLTVNGESYGLHLNIETQDAQSLENEFGTPFAAPPQHLYAGEYGADVTDEPLPRKTSEKQWEGLEVSEGKKKEKEDLEELVAAVEATTPSFSRRVASVADLEEMTKDWLVEKYVGNWDGYAGQSPDYYHPNNYYLYSDPSGRFQMMPWGTDETWESGSHLDFGEGGGILFSDCMGDIDGCRRSYLAAGREALTALDATGLDTVARCTAAALRPWQEVEAETSERDKLPDPSVDGEENLEKAAEEVAATRDFIASRPKELAEFLEEPTPSPRTTEPTCPPLRPVGGFPSGEEPSTGGSSSSGTSAATSPAGPAAGTPPTSGRIKLLHWHRSGGSVAVRLEAPGPGRFVVRGSYGKAGSTACRGAVTVEAAGTMAVDCRLTHRFAVLLRRRAHRISLEARFVPAAGAVESVVRTIRLSSRRPSPREPGHRPRRSPRSLELRRWPTHPSSS